MIKINYFFIVNATKSVNKMLIMLNMLEFFNNVCYNTNVKREYRIYIKSKGYIMDWIKGQGQAFLNDMKRMFTSPTPTDIVNMIATGLTTLFAIMAFHFIIFAIVGIFKKKTYPHTNEKLRYGIIIPARNEEAVVGNLIESIRKNNYPQDKIDIFVIAHNCKDNTADVARAMGAIVYEYNNPEENTMGYAFRYLFDRIKEDYGIESYDGYFLFNADNIVDANYFDKMNDAYVAMGKKHTITSFRNSKNFGSNVISALYGLHFMYGCRYECRGRTVVGCSTRIQGTGYVISPELVKNGWKYVTLTEDWEFSTDQVIAGQKIYYCDEAVFYDEQPTNFRIMWRQKVRWCRGHFLVFFTRIKDIIKAQFKSKKKGGCPNKGSLHDISINILPLGFLATLVTFLQIVALITIAVIEGCTAGVITNFPEAMRVIGIIMGNFGRNFVIGFLTSYLTLLPPTILIYILERKRIKNVSFLVKLASLLAWPIFFVVFATIQDVQAVFSRKLGWKEIPHGDTTNFSDLNQENSENLSSEESAVEMVESK